MFERCVLPVLCEEGAAPPAGGEEEGTLLHPVLLVVRVSPAKQFNTYETYIFLSVFWIRGSLVRIRIRGSVPTFE
jgi:hypothetical protein